MDKVQAKVGRRPQLTRTALSLAGVALLIVFVTIVVLALLGPAVGNVSSNILAEIVTTSGSSGSGKTESVAAQIPAKVPSRVILREGYVALIVEDTHATMDGIKGIVGEMASEGAFIVTSEERVDVESQMSTASMAIRVPAERFDEVMDRLSALAVRVEERREKAEDVTEEYVDVQGRLASMESARDGLRRIMGEAETVEELLRVEQQLAEREAEIESLQGRLEFLAESAELSRVEIRLRHLVVTQPATVLWQPGETARRAYAGLVKSVQDTMDFMIYFGIADLPWVVVVGLVAYGIWRVVRRYSAPRAAEKVEEPPSEGKAD